MLSAANSERFRSIERPFCVPETVFRTNDTRLPFATTLVMVSIGIRMLPAVCLSFQRGVSGIEQETRNKAGAKRSGNFIIKIRSLAIQLVLVRNGSAVGAGGGPLDFAGGVGFLFPDGDAGLDGVDGGAVGVKGGFAMG